MYQLFPHNKFNQLAVNQWFQVLTEHISVQVEPQPGVVYPGEAETLPRAAHTLCFLWMFYEEAGAHGIEGFLQNSNAEFTPQVHEALRAVGARELVKRLEAAVPLGLAMGIADFGTGADHDWYWQFPFNPDLPSLQAVDEGLSELAGPDLLEKANDFIAANRKTLIG